MLDAGIGFRPASTSDNECQRTPDDIPDRQWKTIRILLKNGYYGLPSETL